MSKLKIEDILDDKSRYVSIEPHETLMPCCKKYPDQDRQMPARYDGMVTGYVNNHNFEQIKYDIFHLRAWL